MGHRIVTGLRLNRFGQLNRNGVERPLGGGLEVLALKLHCQAHQVQAIQLSDWIQVWVNADKVGEATNPVLSRMVSALSGQEHALGGAGLFLATVPNRWEVVGLSAEQEARIWGAWQATS